jgi:hypothetical protein
MNRGPLITRIDDDASPDPEAIARQENRKARQQEELSFETAAERFDDEGNHEGRGE